MQKKKNYGFTLVELIVVLVILAILAAILVPALLSWIDKAKNKSAMLECRAVVQAAQGRIAELYAMEAAPSKDVLQNKMNEEENLIEIKKLADVQGKIHDQTILLSENFVISRLVYSTQSGVRVIYDKDGDPVYLIGGDIVYTNDAPGYLAWTVDQGKEALDKNSFLDKNGKFDAEKFGDLIKDYEAMGNGYKSRKVQALYLLEYGKSFPRVDWEQLKLPGNLYLEHPNQEAYWKPIVTAEEEIILVADSLNSKGNALATIVYYNNTYYYHRHSEKYPNKISNKSINDVTFTIDELTSGNEWFPFTPAN